jgi:hypothetical protein
MPSPKNRGLDEQQLEGGVGGGASAGISGTKWSNMPSLRGKASTLGDIKKIMSESEHLKGGAKRAVEEARTRAKQRTAIRAAGADAAYEGLNHAVGAKNSDESDYKPTAKRTVREETPEAGEATNDMKKGGTVSASRRADGIAMRGKTRGKLC